MSHDVKLEQNTVVLLGKCTSLCGLLVYVRIYMKQLSGPVEQKKKENTPISSSKALSRFSSL